MSACVDFRREALEALVGGGLVSSYYSYEYCCYDYLLILFLLRSRRLGKGVKVCPGSQSQKRFNEVVCEGVFGGPDPKTAEPLRDSFWSQGNL